MATPKMERNKAKSKIAKKMKPKFDLVTSIMAHEDGSLDKSGEKELFAHLEKKGLTDKLQGHYGRYARANGYKK